jgi:hypothetical protein
MQVFLPDANFATCAEVLDTKRLVKQLLEGRQIMNVLAGESTTKGWTNHPAVRMFEGYEQTLYTYLSAIRNEMQKRGYKWEKNWAVIQDLYNRHFAKEQQSIPFWMSDESLFTRVVITHRGRLWEKDPIHYADYAPEGAVFMNYVCCPDKCTYYWATHNTPLIHLDWGNNEVSYETAQAR